MSRAEICFLQCLVAESAVVASELLMREEVVLEGWASEEDDLAVSARLEQLQREREGGGMGGPGEHQTEVFPLTCAAPSKILYIYQPEDEDKEEEEPPRTGGGAREVVCGGTSVNVSNLEIDPSSIVADSECVTESGLGDEGKTLLVGQALQGPAGAEIHVKTGGGREQRLTEREEQATVSRSKTDCRGKTKGPAARSRSGKRSDMTQEQQGKRKRGRPPKTSTEPKRPRGRPRKKDRERKPSSLPVKRESGSPPHGSPQTGEGGGTLSACGVWVCSHCCGKW